MRIPTLDGWRALAILMVLSDHFVWEFIGHAFPGSQWFLLGEHGVSIFFVLSGYLITTKLISRPINLKDFYVRRIFRLLPAAWAFLLFLEVLTHFGLNTIGGDVWGCLLFFRNYVPALPEYATTSHFWSLAVEEQFYLVWPALLLLGRKRAAIVAGLVVVGVSWFRVMHWAAYAGRYEYFTRSEMCVDKLMIGCLLGLALSRDEVRDWFARYGRVVFPCCAALFLYDVREYWRLVPLHEGLIIAAMIGATATSPRMLASRALEIPNVRLTGQMSYSIYLWQGVFFRGNWGPLAFVLLPLAAFGSYLLIEKPGIRLGSWLLKPRASAVCPPSVAVPLSLPSVPLQPQ